MAWLSRNTFQPSDYIHADDLNNLANDDQTWGGNVNGGGYTLSNVTLEGVQLLGSGQVTSVFGRSGDVIAEPGDYTAAQVGAVPTTRKVNAGAGLTVTGGGQLNQDITLTAQVISVFGRTGPVILTPADITGATGVLNSRQILTPAGSGLQGGGNLNADLTLSVKPDTVNQQVQVLGPPSATLAGTRHAINFIAGTYMAVSAVDNPSANRVDVTINSTIVPGMGDPTTTTGDLIVHGSAGTTRLPVGSPGQILYADNTAPLGVKWALPPGANPVTSVFGRTGDVIASNGDYSAAMVTNAVDATASYPNPPWIVNIPWAKITNPPNFLVNVLQAKGDIPVQVSTTAQGRLPVGSDGSLLTADSTTTLGVKWASVPIAAVTSVFGRTGTVVAANGDYSVGQVTGAVPNTLVIGTGTGLSGGGSLTQNLNLAVVPNTVNQQVQVLNTGALRGTRHAINFIVGSNITLSIQDNTANDWVDVAVASNGGGTGLPDPTTTIGDLIVRGIGSVERLPVGPSGAVLTADSSQPLGVKWVQPIAGGGQTPWVGNVNGAGFNLNNAGAIGVNANSNSVVARIYVVPSSMEDGLAVVSGITTAFSSLGVLNDTGASLRIRSYGSAYPTDPGLASIEASAGLKFVSSAAEVMRLHSGRLLIGTTADDNTNTVQVNGKVKSLAGGFVFPDGTVQTTAFTAGASPVTSVFGRTGAVTAAMGDYDAAQVSHAVSTLGSYPDPAWITSLSWGKLTGVPPGASFWQAGSGGAIYYNSGAVGIGTSTPLATLHLYAASLNLLTTPLILENTDAANGSGNQEVAMQFRVGRPGAYRLLNIKTVSSADSFNNQTGLAFEIVINTGSSVSTTEAMRLTQVNGLPAVGIGSTAPARSLVVVGSPNPVNSNSILMRGYQAAFELLNAAANQNYYFGIDDADSSKLKIGIGQSAQQGLTPTITLTAGEPGNVGIGTVSPNTLLSVGAGSFVASVPTPVQISTGGSGTEAWYGANKNGAFGLLVGYSNGSNLSGNILTGGLLRMVSSDPLYFMMNNSVVAVTLTASGNVGIGTTNPGYTCQVSGSFGVITNANTLARSPFLNQNTQAASRCDIQIGAGSQNIYFGTQVTPGAYGWGEYSYIDSPGPLLFTASSVLTFGHLSIGTPSPSSSSFLQVHVGTNENLSIGGPISVGGSVTISAANDAFSANTPLEIRGNPTCFMTGSVGIGTTGPDQALTVNGWVHSISGGFQFPDGSTQTTAAVSGGATTTITWQVNSSSIFTSSGNSTILNFTGTGQSSVGDTVAGNSLTYTIFSASDERAKQNVEALVGGLTVIQQIRPIHAEWNGALGKPKGEPLAGVIAQEIADVLPEAVYTVRIKLHPEDEQETDVLGLEPMAIVAHLILAVQQLQAKIEDLEKRSN